MIIPLYRHTDENKKIKKKNTYFFNVIITYDVKHREDENTRHIGKSFDDVNAPLRFSGDAETCFPPTQTHTFIRTKDVGRDIHRRTHEIKVETEFCFRGL